MERRRVESPSSRRRHHCRRCSPRSAPPLEAVASCRRRRRRRRSEAVGVWDIEDTILLALQNPEVYDDIARGTRCKFESNRPRAVLFEGPPGRWPEPHPYPLGFYSTSSYRSDSSPSLLPRLLVAGVMRAGMLEMAHADADENPTVSEPLPSFGVVEGLANQERQRLEELLRSKGIQRGSSPFTVSVRGQKVSIKFRIPLTCEASHDIVSLVSQLRLKAEENNSGSETLLCAWDRNPSGNLTSHPYKMGSG